MPDKPINHAWDHRPGGTDPLPLDNIVFNSTYALFSKTITAVASDTETVFDLSTATSVSTNEASAVAGSSWTGTNFAYDTGDPDFLHILTPGTYVYEGLLWLGDGTTPTGSPFSAKIEETGSLFLWGLAGAAAMTQQYLDPGFVGGSPSAAANMNVFRHATYYFGNPGTFPAKRGISFAHNYGSALDVGVGMVVFRVAP
jgi:hypothetical protein